MELAMNQDARVRAVKDLAAACLLMLSLAVLSCAEERETTVKKTPCDVTFTATAGEAIPAVAISAPRSSLQGDTAGFLEPCPPGDKDPLIVADAVTRTHQVIVDLGAIHPLRSADWTGYAGQRARTVETVSIDLSLNGLTYRRAVSDHAVDGTTSTIALDDAAARFVRFVFAADGTRAFGVQDIRFILGSGYIVREDSAWSGAFFRRSGWTGADGIFAYNLDSGDRSVGAGGYTGFVFSDTLIGEVFAHNSVRSDFTMVNNTLGYFDPGSAFEEAFTFAYPETDGRPGTVFAPDAYIGKRARHLLDGDGLSVSRSPDALLTNSDDGTMWRSSRTDVELMVDLMVEEPIHRISLWNYNADTSLGVKAFDLFVSRDGSSWVAAGHHTMERASGSASERSTLAIAPGGITARYLRIVVRESYSDAGVGLGKIMIFGDDDRFLYGRVTASHEIVEPTTHEGTARLWLQDGIVLGDTFYTFPLLVKDLEDLFRVHSVGLIEVPLVDRRFEYENATFHSTPFQFRTADGGIVYFGAGVLDHRPIDGYVYVYGYKDLDGRHLVVARFQAEDVLRFNRWTFFDGHGWSVHAHEVAPLKEGVSPELSVTRIPAGHDAGRYMLVVMEKTVSGRIVYAVGDHPWGPFGEYGLLYETTEASYLTAAFTYNAKMHAHLSDPGNYLISYNVNTHNLGALRDARIYYPRFIRMVEVSEP